MKFAPYLSIVIFLLAGCNREKVVVPVSGIVTLDGKPLAGTQVTFQPIGKGKIDEELGEGSFAKTDENGKFTLKYVGPGDRMGAVVGSHRVMIAMPSGVPGSDDISKPGKIRIPVRYNTDSQLTFDVTKGGTTSANFDLTSNP